MTKHEAMELVYLRWSKCAWVLIPPLTADIACLEVQAAKINYQQAAAMPSPWPTATDELVTITAMAAWTKTAVSPITRYGR